MNLLERLLSTDLLENNEYLDKYIRLIESNRSTQRALYKTQKHHIIPKCYYKSLGIPIDNSDENVVNLLFADHVMAHYYLSKCSKVKWFTEDNSLMVILNSEKCDCGISNEEFQRLYEASSKKIGASKRGKCYVYKDNHLIMISKDDLDYYLSIGYKPGNNKLKNKVCLTNGVIDIIVNKEESQQYLDNGYRIGHTHKTSQKLHGYKTVHKGDIQLRVPCEDVNKMLLDGYELGVKETAKSKQGHPNPYKGTKGLVKSGCDSTVWVNNGEQLKRIKKDELTTFLTHNSDYKIGALNFCWIHNSDSNLQIPIDKLEYYLSIGYSKGMLKRKNKHE